VNTGQEQAPEFDIKNAAPIILYNLRRDMTPTVNAQTYSFNEKAETLQF
jgi:hypothetical protein